ncbi:hypothetical protein PMAYCL1PPCAC_31918, partial [Pristionchus mayeri]
DGTKTPPYSRSTLPVRGISRYTTAFRYPSFLIPNFAIEVRERGLSVVCQLDSLLLRIMVMRGQDGLVSTTEACGMIH